MSIWEKYSADAFALAGIIDCGYEDLLANQQHPERVEKRTDRQICNWYLPSFDNAYYGGVMTILRFADHMLRVGRIRQRFLICGDVNEKVIRAKIIDVFPSLQTCEVLVLNSAERIQSIPASDFSIATLWTTAYVLLGVQNTGLKFYFIQDFEPLFYPAGSTYAQAELTYRFGFYGIANTVSVRKLYEERYGGKSAHFTPCIDPKVFFPPAQARSSRPKCIFFYGRPGHPRNAFELAVSALKLLKRKYGDSVEIVCAGADWNVRDYGLDGVVKNVGLLSYSETGNLYRKCHIGLGMMMTSHPSYLPFELMACGAVVVSNYNTANTWLLQDGVNCLLSPASGKCLMQTLSYAVENYDDLERLRHNAVASVSTEARSWDQELSSLLDFIRGSLPAPAPLRSTYVGEQEYLRSMTSSSSLKSQK